MWGRWFAFHLAILGTVFGPEFLFGDQFSLWLVSVPAESICVCSLWTPQFQWL